MITDESVTIPKLHNHRNQIEASCEEAEIAGVGFDGREMALARPAPHHRPITGQHRRWPAMSAMRTGRWMDSIWMLGGAGASPAFHWQRGHLRANDERAEASKRRVNNVVSRRFISARWIVMHQLGGDGDGLDTDRKELIVIIFSFFCYWLIDFVSLGFVVVDFFWLEWMFFSDGLKAGRRLGRNGMAWIIREE